MGLKNLVKRKTHKERSQPLARRRFGLLEKKKDYKLRAKDYHRKEDYLQLLRKKADDKNPDEFYFSMEHAATRNGVHIKKSAVANKYSQAELRLMKTQDVKYIALKAQQEAKKVEKLRQNLHCTREASQSQRTVFVNDQAELQSIAQLQARPPSNDSDEEMREDQEGISERDYRKDREPVRDPKLEARLKRYKKSAYNELRQRQERQQKLIDMAQHMQLKKELMGKGGKTKIKSEEDGGRSIYKWSLERKR